MSKTALVTGASGYIGSWVCKFLLEEGYSVRATVRNTTKTERYAHLQAIADAGKGRLEFREADLLQEGAFDDAAKGCDVVYHIASPFINQVKNPQRELIDPALLGTRNVLHAANRSGTVKKVILTSSAAAIYGDVQDMSRQGLSVLTEEQWNTTSSLEHVPYSYSKLLAEKEAWAIAGAQDQWQLVVLNPTFVLGPSLAPVSDSESIKLVRDMLKGKYATGVPDLYFGFVDVRDVAKAHLLAEQNPKAQGRYIICNKAMPILEIGQLIAKASSRRLGLPFFVTPKWLTVLLGPLFGLTRNFMRNNVGYPLRFDNSKAIRELGMQYRDIETSIRDMVAEMRK
jgi:nucleoside-diphosphate-sugar epimerase